MTKFFKAVYHGEITKEGETVNVPGYYWAKPGLQQISCDSPRPMKLMLWEILDAKDIAEHHPHFHEVSSNDASSVNTINYTGKDGFYHVTVGGPVGPFAVTVLMPL